MPRSRNPYRQASYWLTNLPARVVGIRQSDAPAAAIPETFDTLRHGYTLDGLDRLARIAVQVHWTMAGAVDDRYATAWSAIVEELYASDTAPSERVLIGAGQAAIRDEVRSIHRTFGRPLDGGDGTTYGVLTYWWLHSLPTQGPERSVVEREALRQVLPLVPDVARRTLFAVASCDGDRERAARLLGVEPRTVWKWLGVARGVIFAAWHEGETPPAVWREPRRKLADDKLVPCGTESAYHRHRRRGEPTCEPCRSAVGEARKVRSGKSLAAASPP